MKKNFKKVSSVFLSFLLMLLLLPSGSVLAQDLSLSSNSATPTATTTKKQVIGYITQWDAWKDTNAGLPAQGALNQLNIDYSQYTILNYSFFGVANDGSLHSGDFRNKNIYQPGAVQQPSPLLFTDIYSSWDLYLLFGDIEYAYYVNADIAARAQAQGFDVKENGSTWSNPSWNLYNQPLPMPIKKANGAPGLLELGKQNGVKVLASIGGWSMCKHFPEMAADPAKRARFIEDCKRLIAMGFDGIDLDWEYVGPFEGMNFKGSNADYANFITLIKEIRQAIGQDKLLTSCFSANINKLDNFNWPEIDKYLDYYNFMTYDFNGGWSNKAGHNAPLYSYTNAEEPTMSLDNLYQYLATTNINMNKVNMGVPFYGRGVITNGTAALNAPTVKRNETIQPDGPISTCADYTNWAKDVYDGTPNYSYIKQKVLASNSGWTVKWDDEAKVPYAVKDNFFLSFDNEESIGYKAQYIKDHNLAGTIVWNVFGDLEFGGTVTNYGTKLKKWSNVKSPLVAKINQVFNNGIESVATPVFSPKGGVYDSAQDVTISCATSGATIRYTTDGTEPTATSSVYTGPINIIKTTTLKAKAFKAGMNDSTTASATYTIGALPLETVATPTLSPNGGTFTSAQNVTINCATSGATIRYTVDGTEPIVTSTAYTSPINVSKTTTIKVKAFKEGMNDSATALATYTIQDNTVVKPWAPNTAYVKGDIVSYNGKNYECRQPHTSLPGWEPTNVPALWQEYKGSVTPVETVANPTFTPVAGVYTSAQSVTLTCATSGATIRYTTDGTEPTANSPVYSSTISVAKTTTLKAKAFKSGMNDSATVSATYTIEATPIETVAAPTFSPNGGTFTSPQSVTLTCATSGATIRYTTDGAEPTANSSVYSTAINVSNTTTLKAKAFKDGMNDSTTASATYTIETTPIETVATPTFSPDGGTFSSAQSVTISCATSGSTITYTTDGTEPNTNSSVYSGSINVSNTTTLKAKAFKDGMNDSSIASATYTIESGTVINPWAPNTAYALGDIVSYNGKNYECRQAHTSLPGWEPSNIPALWLEYTTSITTAATAVVNPIFMSFVGTSTSPELFYTLSPTLAPDNVELQSEISAKPWAPNTAYAKSDMVSYNGKNYECRQAHTSLLGWEPPNVPALWLEYNGSVTPVETVEAPTFTPASGTYTSTQNVTIACVTSGATIRYTTDGSEPTSNSNIYSSPINVSTTTTLKAKAFKTGMNDSTTVSATYTIEAIPVETVSAPNISPNGGTFTSAQSVTITCTTDSATIRYTTDGTEPTTNSTIYSNPINVSTTTTIKAKAFKNGMNDSPTTSVTYTIQVAPVETVATPTFTPNGGTFTSSQNVTIACTTSDAIIRYTTNGTEPTANSTIYSGVINISATTTLKAKAFKAGMNDSSTSSATYTIQGAVVVKPWAPNTAYVKGDIVSYNGKNYECRQPHTSLLGWEPTNVPALWQEYSGSVTPIQTVANPTFTPVAGTYTSAQNVTLTCATSGATIRYTTDGTEPTANSSVYSSAINVAKTTTLKAKAFKSGMTDSATVSATYTIQITPVETVETPNFSPNGGTYTSSQSITITCTTPGATIRYTTDGTEPTANSSVYSSPINVAKTTTLKAKAFKSGMNDSAIVSATYTIGTTPISPLPKHILTGYWQNFDNGAKCLKISDVPTSYDLICVSFADATATPGAISFTLDPTLSSRLGGYTKEEFIQDIATAKTKGQKVIISVGGEKGTIRVADATAATNFANSVYALMQEYGFDGVDIDLENGINATYMGSALRQLSAKAGPNLIITMAPQTIDMQSTGMEYFKLALSIKDILTVVNTQYYNSGAMLGQDGKVYSQGSVDFLTALAAIQLENGLRPDQVGLGLPASPSGAGGGYVNPTVVNTALNCLATGSKGGSYVPPNTYPDIRGAMTWSINWDASNGYNFANTIRPVLDALSSNTTPTKIATPTFSPTGGTYTSSQTVTLSCTTSGATIRYTTNGTESTSASPAYTSPIALSTTTTLKAKAFKTGMTDSDTATATYTINPTGNTTLPKRLLIGYWHTWGGGPSGGVPFVKLRDVNPNWNVINISFSEPVSAGSTDGKMKFQVSGLTADYTINDFKADIKLLQSQGKKVVLSIGGYEGYFSLTSAAAVNQFVSDIKSFVNEYGFDGIDIDLEQSSVTFNSGADPDYKNPTSPKIVNMISAIRQICDAYDKDFILSWAPETYYMQLGYQYYGGLNANVDNRAGVYLPMIHALRDKTTYVHTQLYNSIVVTAPDGKTYSMGNAEATVAMCKMLLDGFNVGGKAEYFFEPLRADQVAIGVPASSSAAGSGHITNTQLQQAFDTLLTNYPNLRGIMTWSINWDAHQNNNSFAISNGQYLTSKK